MTYVHNDAELRRWPRASVDLAGFLSARARVDDVLVVDLSLGGCLVQCEAPLDSGSIVDLQLDLDGRMLAMKGRVAHTSLDGTALPATQRYLVGVEFMGVAVDDESRLLKFLDQRFRQLGLSV